MPQAQTNTRRCPECGAEIDHLDYCCNVNQWGQEYGTADFDGDATDTTDTDISDSETNDYEYQCPTCGEDIGTEDTWDTEEESEEEKARLAREEAERPRDLETEPTGELYEKKRRKEDTVIVTCRSCRYQWESDLYAEEARKILDNPRKKEQILCPRCETRARKQDVVFV